MTPDSWQAGTDNTEFSGDILSTIPKDTSNMAIESNQDTSSESKIIGRFGDSNSGGHQLLKDAISITGGPSSAGVSEFNPISEEMSYSQSIEVPS